MAFSAVMALRASATALSRAWEERAFSERRICFTFDQACSIGFRSGE
jgi:hypothetical protein